MTLFYPKFLEKNKINKASLISDSAGNSDVMKRKLFDRNYEIKYFSTGEISGTRTITFTPESVTSINRIFIQNCNWKTFTIKYNGTSTFSVPITVTNGSNENYYFEFNAVSITTIDFSITDTIVASETAKCGQIYVGNELFTVDQNEGGGYRINPIVEQTLIKVSDGSYSKVYLRTIINYILNFQAVDTTNKAFFVALFNRNRQEPFVFIPRPTTIADTGDEFLIWDGLANHYHWANNPDYYNFTNDLVLAGYDVNIELVQASGV